MAKNDLQVGGDHYDLPISPIEYIEANNLPFSEGNIVKYISRHEQKNKDEDIKKIISYAKLILRYRYKYTNEQLKEL